MKDVKVEIYNRSITIPEFRQLRDAIDAADLNSEITYVTDGTGRRLAAIVPVGVAVAGDSVLTMAGAR